MNKEERRLHLLGEIEFWRTVIIAEVCLMASRGSKALRKQLNGLDDDDFWQRAGCLLEDGVEDFRIKEIITLLNRLDKLDEDSTEEK